MLKHIATSKNIVFWLFILLLVLISYFLYSSKYYALLNSDDALNILMAYYYSLPEDLYCWGQDRGGTLIPLISQIFIKGFKLAAIDAVSLSNYFLLILGFLGLVSMIKNMFFKLTLGLIWFFPFERYIDLLRFPIGMSYSLIGFSILLLHLLQRHYHKGISKN